jgi:ribosomal protein S18 acetylase RimI-like enzyme
LDIEIRALGPGDDEIVLGAVADVFDNVPRPALTAEFLNDPRHHIVVALDAGQVVGFVSAVHYVHPDKDPELWVNEVSVAPTHRNLQIGHRMMLEAFALGRKRGCRCAWVLTDGANTAAMRLYAAAGGVAEPVPSVLFEFNLENDRQGP